MEPGPRAVHHHPDQGQGRVAAAGGMTTGAGSGPTCALRLPLANPERIWRQICSALSEMEMGGGCVVTTSKRWTGTDAGFRLLNRIHKSVLRVTGGRWPTTLSGMAAVKLHTIGRKSGLPRSSMLTSPIHDESRVVLVASKGGHERNPLWYGNLRANPDVEVTMNGTTRAMRARTASPEEKAEMWPQIVATYKNYARYQEDSGRDLPVVICEPRPS
jgi:deazaflavin-dependent oxidoreductase (nitroreductase family)